MVSDEIMDLLLSNYYHGQSRSLISELESRVTHEGPIHKNDNEAVFVSVEEADRGISVEPTIKSFSATRIVVVLFKP